MTDKDIGDYLEVPEEEREDVDPPAEYNADAGFDIEVVPDGEVVELESGEGEPRTPVRILDEADDEGDDGAPLHFIDPQDPEYDEEKD